MQSQHSTGFPGQGGRRTRGILIAAEGPRCETSAVSSFRPKAAFSVVLWRRTSQSFFGDAPGWPSLRESRCSAAGMPFRRWIPSHCRRLRRASRGGVEELLALTEGVLIDACCPTVTAPSPGTTFLNAPLLFTFYAGISPAPSLLEVRGQSARIARRFFHWTGLEGTTLQP
jgi:hypothetical protein